MLVRKAIEISDAKIQFISLVDKAANKHQFLLTKAADGNAQFSTFGKILKVDEATHYVTGIVYEPLTEDAHGNFMTEDEIRKAAHWFAKHGDQVDLQHSFEAVDGVIVVENYVAPCDMCVGNARIAKGTWLITAEITNAGVWNAVQKGVITGFSMGGLGKYSEEDVSLDEVEKATESTAEKRGLFKKLAGLLGFDVVEKGPMADAYKQSARRSNFWDAFYALEDILYRYNWTTDSYEFETDESKIRDALTDFSAILPSVLSDANVVKALSDSAPVNKAGKKISRANKEKLETAYQALAELRDTLAELDENETIEKEDTILTKTEVQALIEAAVAKAAGTPAPDTVTTESVQKMIDAGIQKALETPAQETPSEEHMTPDSVQKMIDESVEKAVNSLRQARGFPSNLNSEKEVEKSADLFAGLFV